MSRVLVTGASGFIGRPVVRQLAARGHEVHALARGGAPAANAGDGSAWHRIDLLDTSETLRLVREMQPSHLLHLAWCAVPGEFWTSRENVDWVGATLELSRAFVEAGGRRAVLAGSCAEYEWSGGVCDERHTPTLPRTLYGACKHATHVAAEALFSSAGASHAWGRIFFVYGPGEDQRRLVASVIAGLLRGERVATTAGRQRRDFLHVEDVAAAFVALLESDVNGAVNIASGHAPPVREVVELIGELTHASSRIDIGALSPRSDEPDLIVGTAERLRESGFRARYELAEGLRQTVRWWQQQLAG